MFQDVNVKGKNIALLCLPTDNAGIKLILETIICRFFFIEGIKGCLLVGKRYLFFSAKF